MWVLVVLACSLPATAETVLERIAGGGKLVLAHRESSIPFSYLDQDQKPVGYALDICHKLADAKIKYCYCATPPDARQGLLILRVMNAKKALKVLNGCPSAKRSCKISYVQTCLGYSAWHGRLGPVVGCRLGRRRCGASWKSCCFHRRHVCPNPRSLWMATRR